MHRDKVFFIKLVHSIIFFFMVLCLVYILYCAITMTYNWILLIALGAIFLEGLAIIINRWQCPLTGLAEKYGAENGAVTGIFLPLWFVPHAFTVFTIIFVIELIWLGVGYFG